jgi:hypothetical protein
MVRLHWRLCPAPVTHRTAARGVSEARKESNVSCTIDFSLPAGAKLYPRDTAMKSRRGLTYVISVLLVSFLVPIMRCYGQTDIQQAVQQFLQAWYVDKKPAAELKGYIAKDNGFYLPQLNSSNRPLTAARTDPVAQLFDGAFVRGPLTAEIVPPKTLSDAIEYPPAKRPSTARSTGPSCLTSVQFAICRPDQLPPGAVLPARKPTGNDPVAKYLWHLTQAYKGKLYVVLYTTKGGGLLRETAILYWIQEGGDWKLAAFQGTDW